MIDAMEPLLKHVTPSPVAPIPTVIPDIPEYQTAGEVGQRTLWSVQFVLSNDMIPS